MLCVAGTPVEGTCGIVAPGLGACGFCSGLPSGFFSATDSEPEVRCISGGVTGATAGGCASALGGIATGTGVFSGVNVCGTIEGWTASGAPGFSVAGTGFSETCLSLAACPDKVVVAALFCKSPAARCNLTICLAFSSESSFSCLRKLDCCTKRTMHRIGLTSSINPKTTKKNKARGMGLPRPFRQFLLMIERAPAGTLHFVAALLMGSNHPGNKHPIVSDLQNDECLTFQPLHRANALPNYPPISALPVSFAHPCVAVLNIIYARFCRPCRTSHR